MNDLYCWETKFKYCCYSKRLLIKLLLINKIATQKINILQIKKAIYYARKYHGDQKRQTGKLYYSHPLEVAYMVADYVIDTDALVISILHDTLCKALHKASYAKKIIMQSKPNYVFKYQDLQSDYFA